MLLALTTPEVWPLTTLRIFARSVVSVSVTISLPSPLIPADEYAVLTSEAKPTISVIAEASTIPEVFSSNSLSDCAVMEDMTAQLLLKIGKCEKIRRCR